MNENEQFARGVAHFNAHEFFEAHEVWEEQWLGAPAGEKLLLQGLIQIAAAFHHYMRGNASGAKSLLSAGIAKIETAPENYRGIDVPALLDAARAWADALAMNPDLRSDRLPRIRTAGGAPTPS